MLRRVFTLATVVFACLFAADASALDVGYDEYADYAVRKALRLVIDSSVGTRLGLQRMPSSIDSRLGLAMNVQSRADRDREFRFGVFGSLGVSEAFYAIAGMGKATGHYAWCTGCITGVDHTKMFSGLSLAAGYQYVSMDPRLVGLVSGLRVEPEFLPFGLRFGEQGQFELALRVTLGLASIREHGDDRFGPTDVATTAAFTWMLVPTRPPVRTGPAS